MFGFIKKCFFTVMIFSCNILNVIPVKFVSMKNQEYKFRTKIIDINSKEPSFYLYNIKVNKFSGSCNNFNDPYAKLCISDIVKNMNVKAFNLISKTNETRNIK